MLRVYSLLLFVMMLWGFNVSALKVLVTYIDPMLITAVRIGVAGIAVLIITYFMGIFRVPTKQEWVTIGVIGLFNVIIHHTFLALGLTSTSGVNAGLILGGAPLITMMLSIILLKDRVTILRILGFIFGFIGIITTTLVGSEGISTISIGDGMVFFAVLGQALSFILISKLNPSFDPRLLTGYMHIFGSVIVFAFSSLSGTSPIEISQLFSWKLGSVFLFSAVLSTAFGQMVYNLSIKDIGPAETAIFINLNTFFSLVGAALFLGEPILINHFVGLIFILLGVFIGTGTLEYILRKRKHKKINPEN